MTFEQRKQQIEEKLLQAKDFLEKMELEDQITSLEIEFGLRESDSYNYETPECWGCG